MIQNFDAGSFLFFVPTNLVLCGIIQYCNKKNHSLLLIRDSIENGEK